MTLKERLHKAFDTEIDKVKTKRNEVYTSLISHFKRDFYKQFFTDEIIKLVEKKRMIIVDDSWIQKRMSDCIDFYVVAFVHEKNKAYESPIARSMREEAHRKHNMMELAQQGEFVDEMAEIKDFVTITEGTHNEKENRKADKIQT